MTGLNCSKTDLGILLLTVFYLVSRSLFSLAAFASFAGGIAVYVVWLRTVAAKRTVRTLHHVSGSETIRTPFKTNR